MAILFTLFQYSCQSESDKLAIRDLKRISINTEPHRDEIFLGFRFDDSRDTVENKMNQLQKEGILRRHYDDSVTLTDPKYSIYNFYYQFEEVEGIEDLRWLLIPEFKSDTLYSLRLVATAFLDGENITRELSTEKGVLKNIIDGTKEVFKDNEIMYRLVKEHLKQLFGQPDYDSRSVDQSWWFFGNCSISVTGDAAKIEILFSDISRELDYSNQ